MYWLFNLREWVHAFFSEFTKKYSLERAIFQEYVYSRYKRLWSKRVFLLLLLIFIYFFFFLNRAYQIQFIFCHFIVLLKTSRSCWIWFWSWHALFDRIAVKGLRGINKNLKITNEIEGNHPWNCSGVQNCQQEKCVLPKTKRTGISARISLCLDLILDSEWEKKKQERNNQYFCWCIFVFTILGHRERSTYIIH